MELMGSEIASQRSLSLFLPQGTLYVSTFGGWAGYKAQLESHGAGQVKVTTLRCGTAGSMEGLSRADFGRLFFFFPLAATPFVR